MYSGVYVFKRNGKTVTNGELILPSSTALSKSDKLVTGANDKNEIVKLVDNSLNGHCLSKTSSKEQLSYRVALFYATRLQILSSR